jgi:serine/threonine protein phosphatase PrpC
MMSAGQRMLIFDTAAVTHQGRVREFNEDSIYTDSDKGIWLVADGVGGHRDGNVASAMIRDHAGNIGNRGSIDELADAFRASIAGVNRELLAISNGESHLLVGSTVVALLIRGPDFRCLWAGDSRCYLIRNNRIQRVSRDHTEVQELVDRGVISASEAATWPRRNVITRAVGADPDLELEQVSGKLQAGDRFILCSDGLTGHVSDEEILEMSATVRARDASRTLLDLALTRGGKDNISVVTVNVIDRDPTEVQVR